jgi:hypothetical protein
MTDEDQGFDDDGDVGAHRDAAHRHGPQDGTAREDGALPRDHDASPRQTRLGWQLMRSSTLHESISALAAQFASLVVAAIRASSVEDIVGLAGASIPPKATHAAPTTGRPRAVGQRPSREGLASPMSLIVKYVRSHPGTTGEAARKALGFGKEKWSYYVRKAIAGKGLRKGGQRRATRYWAT